MAFSRTIEHTITGEFGTASGTFIVESDGWSGEPYIYGTSPEDLPFEFHAEITNSDGTSTSDSNANTKIRIYPGSGYTGAIIGLALENFIAIDNEGERTEEGVIGPMVDKPSNDYTMSWGGVPNDPTHNDISGSDIQIKNFDTLMYNGTEYHNVDNYVGFYTSSGTDGIRWAYRQYPFLQYVFWGWVRSQTTRIKTNLPIFETNADLWEYINSGGTITNKILNKNSPEEEYEDARKYNYVRNIYGHNANNPTQYTGYRNYRFYGGNGKICLYVTQATSGHPFTLKLYNYESYTCKEADIYEYDDESYEEVTSAPATDYLDTSIQFSDSNWYKCFQWSTDLLIFGSLAQAEMWRDDLIDARQALNYDKVSRAYNEILDPGYGDADPGYDNGLNGQSYVHGARMWVMTSGQLNNFFDDIFDPVNINNILDGTKLFGSNEIQAIQGITYFPLDLDDVATVYGSAQAIKIGSFTCPTATGRYVQNNNKLLNCGKVFISPVYNDFRDYRIKLFISLPYCGVHELNISKFLHHYLQVYYAVDITTGACSAHVLADGISYGDTFDGFMASQRPITALDQTAYLSSVMSSVSSIVHREAGMISDAKSAIAGVATGNTKGATSGPSGLDISSGAISDLYNLSQAVKDVPMTSRGGFAGCLGFFGNQQIHIITVQSKTVKPSLEQQIVGYPSHVSQRIGNFSGFLKTSAINLNNFSGTAQELEDIHNALAKGIYI